MQKAALHIFQWEKRIFWADIQRYWMYQIENEWISELYVLWEDVETRKKKQNSSGKLKKTSEKYRD